MKPIAAKHQGVVEAKQHDVGPPALPQDEAIALTHAAKKGGPMEGVLGDCSPPGTIGERGELVKSPESSQGTFVKVNFLSWQRIPMSTWLISSTQM